MTEPYSIKPAEGCQLAIPSGCPGQNEAPGSLKVFRLVKIKIKNWKDRQEAAITNDVY